MPRTILTIIEDVINVIRQAGRLKKIEAEWEFPIELHDGWVRSISVNVHLSDIEEHRNEVWVSVFACGWPKNKDTDRKNRIASRHFYGWAKPDRFTRKWVDETLRREIETAHLAAQAFTEADLHECGSFLAEDDDDAMERFQHEREYFENSLKT